MNFAITSIGRSGTKFLAKCLNDSTSMNVIHEAKGDNKSNMGNLCRFQKRFKDNYGEVNSFLRNVFSEIKVDKKAIIIRNPNDIVVSACNKHPRKLSSKNSIKNIIKDVSDGIILLDRYISDDSIYYFMFEDMIKDINCILSLGSFLGVKINKDMINIKRKINNTNRQLISSIEETGCDTSCFDWFIEKYYKG